MPKFTEAPEVKEIALELIKDHHPHLKNVRIDCVFSNKQIKAKGKVTWATARKVSGLNAFLAKPSEEDFELTGDPSTNDFFCITVYYFVWEMLDDAKKRALVDHELCHCGAEEDLDKEENSIIKLSILPHDLEEFSDIVRRHGLWCDDVKKFLEAGKSLPMTAEIIEMSSQVKRFNDQFISEFTNPSAEQDEEKLNAVIDAVLDEGPKIGPVTAGRLATHFNIGPGNAVYLYSLLERRGLLTKPDGNNNRYVIPKPKAKRKQS